MALNRLKGSKLETLLCESGLYHSHKAYVAKPLYHLKCCMHPGFILLSSNPSYM